MKMNKEVFVKELEAKIASKTESVQFFWNTEEFTEQMNFLHNLPSELQMHQFSEAIKGLIANPLFKKIATEDDKMFIQSVILDHPWLMHYTAVEDYLRATEDYDLAMFYIDHVVSLEPCGEEIANDDPRSEKVRVAFASVRTLHKESLRDFCRMVRGQFPNLPKGKEGDEGGGLNGLIERGLNPNFVCPTKLSISIDPMESQKPVGKLDIRFGADGKAIISDNSNTNGMVGKNGQPVRRDPIKKGQQKPATETTAIANSVDVAKHKSTSQPRGLTLVLPEKTTEDLLNMRKRIEDAAATN